MNLNEAENNLTLIKGAITTMKRSLPSPLSIKDATTSALKSSFKVYRSIGNDRQFMRNLENLFPGLIRKHINSRDRLFFVGLCSTTDSPSLAMEMIKNLKELHFIAAIRAGQLRQAV
jgi:hypothetical protein